MRRMISFVIVMSLLLAFLIGTTLSAGAVPLGLFYGDVNKDDCTDIVDVTLIQRYLAGMTDFDEIQKEQADYDHDGDPGAPDVTALQRIEAGMAVPEEYGGSFMPWSTIHRIYSDYGSGKAVTGVPVTITAEGSDTHSAYARPTGFFEPIEYSFEIVKGDYIRDEQGKIIFDENNIPQYRYDVHVEQEWSLQNSITYTFEKTGRYSVIIKSRNRFGFEDQQGASIEAVEPYGFDLPVITSVITDKGSSVELLRYDRIQPSRDDESLTVTALAAGGSGGYSYAFELKKPNGSVTQDFCAENSFTVDKDDLPGWAEYCALKESENEYISQKFAEGALWVEIPQEFEYQAENYDPYDLIVRVRDSEGHETAETVKIAPIYDFDYVG